MQHNYSYLKILKLKIHTPFFSCIFVPMLLDDKILLPWPSEFFLFLFSQCKILNFCCWFLWKAPWTDQWSKLASFCKITRLSCEETLLQAFHSVDMIFANSKFTIIPSCLDGSKIIFFVNNSSSVTVFYMVLMLCISLYRLKF